MDRTVKVTLKYLLICPRITTRRMCGRCCSFCTGQGNGRRYGTGQEQGLPKLIEAGQQFPFIVVSPQCPSDHLWEPLELTALFDEIVREIQGRSRPSLFTGLSMGGFGTWSLAAYCPAGSPPSCLSVAAATVHGQAIRRRSGLGIHGAKTRLCPWTTRRTWSML